MTTACLLLALLRVTGCVAILQRVIRQSFPLPAVESELRKIRCEAGVVGGWCWGRWGECQSRLPIVSQAQRFWGRWGGRGGRLWWGWERMATAFSWLPLARLACFSHLSRGEGRFSAVGPSSGAQMLRGVQYKFHAGEGVFGAVGGCSFYLATNSVWPVRCNAACHISQGWGVVRCPSLTLDSLTEVSN